MSYAFQSLAKLLRSGLLVWAIDLHKRRAMFQFLNRVSRQCITRSLWLTARLTRASVGFYRSGGRETWMTKIKIRVPVMQA